MAANSDIEWTDHTVGFWEGCQKVSPACDNCYAEANVAIRLKRTPWGPKQPRRRMITTWKMPSAYQRGAAAFAHTYGRRQRIFVNSLSDFFDKDAPQGAREDAWALIQACPDLDWLILTKRPQNISKMLPAFWDEIRSSIWIGVSTENQIELERRTKALAKQFSATNRPAVFFASAEPLFEPLDFSRAAMRFNWIITGGESGKAKAKVRRTDADWHRGVRDYCAREGIPFLFKQWGNWNDVGKWGDKHANGRVLDGVTYNGFPASGRPVSGSDVEPFSLIAPAAQPITLAVRVSKATGKPIDPEVSERQRLAGMKAAATRKANIEAKKRAAGRDRSAAAFKAHETRRRKAHEAAAQIAEGGPIRTDRRFYRLPLAGELPRKGDVVRVRERVFAPRHHWQAPVYLGRRTIVGIVLRVGIGKKTKKPTVSLRVIAVEGETVGMRIGMRVWRMASTVARFDATRIGMVSDERSTSALARILAPVMWRLNRNRVQVADRITTFLVVAANDRPGRVNLSRCKIGGLDLRFALLNHGRFVMTDMTGVDLHGACLKYARFYRSNILEAADLVGADLTGAKGLPAILESAFVLADVPRDQLIVTQQVWDIVRSGIPMAV